MAIYDAQCDNGIEILSEKISYITIQYVNEDLFIAGDLNCRTKNFQDFIPNDNLDFIFNENVSFPTDSLDIPRSSKDKEYNKFGCL